MSKQHLWKNIKYCFSVIPSVWKFTLKPALYHLAMKSPSSLSSSCHMLIYFLDAILWFLGSWSDKHTYGSYRGVDRDFPCRYRDKRPSIAGILVFYIFAMKVSVFLYAYYVYVMIGSWPILFKVLTLNVAICMVLLHFSNFCFSLSSVADISNTEVRAPTSAGRAPFYPRKGLSISHSNLSMAVFYSDL